MTDRLHPWQTAKQRTIYETPIFSLEEHERIEDEVGSKGTFYVIDAPSWINVVAITKEGKFILVEQFRHGSGAFELEIVGGDTEAGEDPQEAAIRELEEETGYVLSPTSTVELLGTTKPNPAFQNNTCFTYLATDLIIGAHGQQFDEFERIRVILASHEEVKEMVRSGKIDHALVLVALAWYELKLNTGLLNDKRQGVIFDK